MSNLWKVVGVIVLAWVAWDLYWGYTVIWDVVYRSEEPALYWGAVAVWFVLGVSCFFSRSSSKDQ